ncbi:hypothetical protein BK026_01840 [Alteromonas sp. V450]|uniref:hypothetical protein n=1 Tax=Alteromonas sp. V450 TaxID=1912139 RepID=UPI0008FF3C8C|nr:hypothetical protein [Alteromonas sp. V450]OJF67627.1 hypothetical protein BK026_01840 [Alteromonas sp. V450]
MAAVIDSIKTAFLYVIRGTNMSKKLKKILSTILLSGGMSLFCLNAHANSNKVEPLSMCKSVFKVDDSKTEILKSDYLSESDLTELQILEECTDVSAVEGGGMMKNTVYGLALGGLIILIIGASA